MSTFNAFYIRANETATLPSLKDGFDGLAVEQRGDFIGVKIPGALKKTPEERLAHFSVLFRTDVIWLGFQSAMDCFEFHHWKSGQHIRSLVYGMEEERTWERSDGTAEPWEREFLFNPRNMECEEAEDEQQQQLINRVYSEARIEVGQVFPSISSKETADAIAHHYGFPFFDLE